MSQGRIKLAQWVPIFFILLYLLPLGLRDLWSPDELRYAEISREMVSSGDWVVPRFNDLRYFEKPVMGYWMNALSQVVFGENAFAVRAASAFSTLGVALCVLLLMRRFLSSQTACIGAGVFLSMFMVAGIGTYSVLDAMLSLWLAACFTAFFFASQEAQSTQQRWKYYGLAGLYCGFAVMTKGFLALALPVLVVLPFMLWQRQFLEILRWGWWVIAVAFLVCLPWGIAVHQAEADYWHYFFWIEHIKRFSAEDAQHSAPMWYYLPFLFAGILPWLFWAPSALKQLKGQWHQPLLRYALLWAVIPLIFFSSAKGKLATYILPCMAPIAILLAYGLERAFAKASKGLRWGTLLNLGLASLLSVAVLVVYFMGKLPLDAEEWYKPWLLALVFAAWAACGWWALRSQQLNSQVSAYMAMPLALFMLAWAIFPNISIDSKMPRRFIEDISHLATPDTLLVADYPDTMSALNWYLKREDVYLTQSKGEVQYGLSYPDAAHRFIRPKQLAEFIDAQQQPVLVYFRDEPYPHTTLPPADQIVQRGRYTAYYFEPK